MASFSPVQFYRRGLGFAHFLEHLHGQFGKHQALLHPPIEITGPNTSTENLGYTRRYNIHRLKHQALQNIHGKEVRIHFSVAYVVSFLPVQFYHRGRNFLVGGSAFQSLFWLASFSLFLIWQVEAPSFIFNPFSMRLPLGSRYFFEKNDTKFWNNFVSLVFKKNNDCYASLNPCHWACKQGLWNSNNELIKFVLFIVHCMNFGFHSAKKMSKSLAEWLNSEQKCVLESILFLQQKKCFLFQILGSLF